MYSGFSEKTSSIFARSLFSYRSLFLSAGNCYHQSLFSTTSPASQYTQSCHQQHYPEHVSINMPFEIAREWSSYHLIPQSVDVALNPPESYFFVTDFLIIACGILYTLCYIFYTIRTYSDRYLAGTVQFLSATMAYEIYYAYICTSTTFQRACFFVWFLFDITFVTVALKYAYKPKERMRTIVKLLWQVPAWMAFLWWVGTVWPDEREQKTAFFTGLYLELPIGWGQILYLVQRQDTKGQSLEIWYVGLVPVCTMAGRIPGPIC